MSQTSSDPNPKVGKPVSSDDVSSDQNKETNLSQDSTIQQESFNTNSFSESDSSPSTVESTDTTPAVESTESNSTTESIQSNPAVESNQTSLEPQSKQDTVVSDPLNSSHQTSSTSKIQLTADITPTLPGDSHPIIISKPSQPAAHADNHISPLEATSSTPATPKSTSPLPPATSKSPIPNFTEPRPDSLYSTPQKSPRNIASKSPLYSAEPSEPVFLTAEYYKAQQLYIEGKYKEAVNSFNNLLQSGDTTAYLPLFLIHRGCFNIWLYSEYLTIFNKGLLVNDPACRVWGKWWHAPHCINIDPTQLVGDLQVILQRYEQKDVFAYALVTFLYQAGLPGLIHKDKQKAINAIKLGVAAGSIISIDSLGRAISLGFGVERYVQIAYQIIRPLADIGYAPSQNRIGFLHFFEINNRRNRDPERIRRIHPAPGDTKSQTTHKSDIVGSKTLKNVKSGEKLSPSSVESPPPNSSSQTQTSSSTTPVVSSIEEPHFSDPEIRQLVIDLLSKNVKKFAPITFDRTIAVKWYQKGADQGYNDSIYNLAGCYLDGLGCTKDLEKTRTLLNQSAAYGDLDAYSLLGLSYYEGNFTPQDYNTAVRILKVAAQNGSPTSQYHLALCYRKGQGVARDLKKGLYWLQKAASPTSTYSGVPEAMYTLGLELESGKYLQKDLKAAQHWFRRAADEGHGLASYKVYKNLSTGSDEDKLASEKYYKQYLDSSDSVCGVF